MTTPADVVTGPSEKSRGVALALAAILGVFGAHRFYVGRTGTGVLMLCTLGGGGLWYLYDLILVIGGSFRDVRGKLVSIWDPEESGTAVGDISREVLEELAVLRSEVAELSERVEFAERLLGQPRTEADSSYSSPRRWDARE